MSVSLAGKKAFVTGGCRGIGKAICRALLAKKCKVCIADIDEPKGERSRKLLQDKFGKDNVMFVKCDVTSDAQFEDGLLAAKGKFGNLDILVNNAGILQERNWERTVDVNLSSVVRGTMLGFKHLSNSNGDKSGNVVNTAAILAVRTTAFLPSFWASKTGVVTLTKCWGHKSIVKKTGIKVSAVCPDICNTELAHSIPNKSIDKVQAKNAFEFIQSEMLLPGDIAQAFIKVLEDDVTGAVMTITPVTGIHYVMDEQDQSWPKREEENKKDGQARTDREDKKRKKRK